MPCAPDGSVLTLRLLRMNRQESPRVRVLGHRAVYDGRVLSLHVDEVEEPGGVRATREVVRHRGSVATLAVSEDDRVILVRQYRYAVDDALWELPAGRLDPGETPEQGARRELLEEVGLEAGEVEPLAVFYTTPGFCDELMHLFRAIGPAPGPAAARGGRADRAALVRARRSAVDDPPGRDPGRQDAGGAPQRARPPRPPELIPRTSA